MNESTTRVRIVDIRNNANPIGDEKFASPRWDLNQERVIVEGVVGQRTNFLIVFLALLFTGAINARDMPIIQFLILVFGAMVCYLLSLAAGRAQKKLDIILSIMRSDPLHPFTVVDNIAGTGSRRRIVGYWIPRICTSALILGAIGSWFGYLSPSKIELDKRHVLLICDPAKRTLTDGATLDCVLKP